MIEDSDSIRIGLLLAKAFLEACCRNSRKFQSAKFTVPICRQFSESYFWPRATLKGPKRSFVVLLVIVGVEKWLKDDTNETKNVNEQNLFPIEQKIFANNMFLIEQKMFAVKIAPNLT